MLFNKKDSELFSLQKDRIPNHLRGPTQKIAFKGGTITQLEIVTSLDKRPIEVPRCLNRKMYIEQFLESQGD